MLIRFHESTKLDTNIISAHSKIISISAANVLLVLANLNLECNDLVLEAYYTSTNKHYKNLMAIMQRTAISTANLVEKYKDGKLTSPGKVIGR